MSFKISDLEKEEFLWLKNSSFYNNLDFQDTMYVDIIVCSIYEKDINLVLKTINFWGVKHIPHEFLNMLVNEKPLKILKHLWEVTNDHFYKFLILYVTKNEL